MMKTQILLPIGLCLLISACGSDDKKATSGGKSDMSAQSDSGKSAPANTAASRASSVAAAANNSKSNNESALDDAIKAGNDDGIYRAASAVLMQNANNTKALNALGIYHLHKGRPLAARLLFNKALSISPNASEFESNLGMTYLATKEDAEAFRRFHKAIELNPRDVTSAQNLAALYMEHRDFQKAYTAMSLASGGNHDIRFLNNFAIASATKGKLDQAESLYREALKISPNSKEVLFNYAILQIDYQSKFKEGLETLDRLNLIGLVEGMRNRTKELENKAKAGLK